MVKTVLIDDEKHFLATLKAILSSQPDIKLAGEARSVESGLQLIEETKPKLVFLDVEMEDGSGFDLLSRVKDRDFQVIFVTAHDHYAINAFRFSALDYLLKPLISTELFSTLEKVRKATDSGRVDHQLNVLLETVNDLSRPSKKIVLKEAEAIHVIQLDEILWCSAEGSYCTFHLTEDRQITISKNLKEYDTLLAPSGFFRIHRSYLVNLNKVKKFDKTEGGKLLLEGKVSLPVSLRKREKLTNMLATMQNA